MNDAPQFSLSVVSHGQAHLIKNLLKDLRSLRESFEIILTINVPEDLAFLNDYRDLPIVVIENQISKGFGANHNAAFRKSRGRIFAVVNPDIRASELDLQSIQQTLRTPHIGACAPRILSASGSLEDSARRFPTFTRLATRVLARGKRQPDYDLTSSPVVSVDWVAGMFVAFTRASFVLVGGFDERYFMYMEDADICRRLRHQGLDIVVVTDTSVVHDAQRASHRSIRHLKWHLRSAVRFLTGI